MRFTLHTVLISWLLPWGMDPDGDSHVDAVRVVTLTNCEGLSIHFMAVTMGDVP